YPWPGSRRFYVLLSTSSDRPHVRDCHRSSPAVPHPPASVATRRSFLLSRATLPPDQALTARPLSPGPLQPVSRPIAVRSNRERNSGASVQSRHGSPAPPLSLAQSCIAALPPNRFSSTVRSFHFPSGPAAIPNALARWSIPDRVNRVAVSPAES